MNLRIGSAVLRVVERAPRCRMIDLAQDGVRPRTKWLKKVSSDRGMFLAVNADVRTAGGFAIGEYAIIGPNIGQQ